MSGYVVDELFAFTSVDEDGDEGILMAKMGNTTISLVFADLTRLPTFAPIAEQIAKDNGIEYKLKHFQLLGDVSDEYIEQYKDLPESVEKADVSGSSDSDERLPNDPGKANGGGKNRH